MSDEQLIPNAVGRLDDVVEAIREGKRGLAVKLLEVEVERRVAKERGFRSQLEDELAKRHAVQNVLAIADSDFDECDGQWIELRRACGWSGVDGVTEPVEELPPAEPALRAENLPDGTKFILGGDEYERRNATSTNGWIRSSPLDGVLSWCYFSPKSLDELIRRGVKFVLPKGDTQ